MFQNEYKKEARNAALKILNGMYEVFKNPEFGGGKISVICREYDPGNGKCIIETEAEKEFTLKVKTDFSQKETALTVEIGKHLYNLKISGV